MNIEIANRLVQLRKKNNLSQEALAEKLGISRQAVSKWERAEASPDTDNLILLARIYGVSLDELLKTEEEIPIPPVGATSEEQIDTSDGEGNNWGEHSGNSAEDNSKYVRVGFNGIHVKDDKAEVHVGWDGIHVDDREQGNRVDVDKNGVYVNGEKKEKHLFTNYHHFPMFLLILIVYLFIGCVWSAWHPGWLLFFLPPIWDSLVEAVKRKNAKVFCYPVVVVLLYLCLGFFRSLWHPGWIVFFTIPLYYSIINWISGMNDRMNSGEPESGSAEEAPEGAGTNKNTNTEGEAGEDCEK